MKIEALPPLPEFADPPLTEVIVGLQFDELGDFSPAHFGTYWQSSLPDWPAPRQAPALEDAFEFFPGDPFWGMSRITLNMGVPPIRMQFRSSDGASMVQVQRSRFLCNWMKTDAVPKYPRWHTLKQQFEQRWAGFCKFVADAGLGSPKVNQWEVAYLNRFPRGTVWQSQRDWGELLPKLIASHSAVGGLDLQGIVTHFVYDLPERKGRMHVEVTHQINAAPPHEESLLLQLTVRGAPGDDFAAGLEDGHRAIVSSFAEVTSERAHKLWGRTQ